MINVPDDIKAKYIEDSVNKNLTVTHKGLDYGHVNHYTGDIGVNEVSSNYTMSAGATSVLLIAEKTNYTVNYVPYMQLPLIDDWDYFVIYVDFNLVSLPAGLTLSDSIYFGIEMYYDQSNPSYRTWWYSTFDKAVLSEGEKMLFIRIPKSENLVNRLNASWKILLYVNMFKTSPASGGEVLTYRVSMPRFFFTKNQYEDATWSEAPNFSTLNTKDLDYVIDNDELTYENFSLTESLCSKDNIKLGLCEAAHCEFEYVGTDEARIGDEITPVSSLKDSSELTDDQFFNINWSMASPTNGRTVSMSTWAFYPPEMVSVRKGTPDFYSVKNKYLKYNAKWKINQFELVDQGPLPTYFKWYVYGYINTGNGDRVAITRYIDSTYLLVSDYFSENAEETISLSFVFSYELAACDRVSIVPVFYKSDYTDYTGTWVSLRINIGIAEEQIRFTLDNNKTMPAWNNWDEYPYYGTLDGYIREFTSQIPLGVFNVASVKKSYKHNLVTRQVEAYDKLVTLENNAADWYTRYMFGIDFDSWNSNGFQFARQIFSSYWDYITSVGLDSDDRYTDTKVADYDLIDLRDHYMTNEVVSWTSSSSARLAYGKVTVSDVDPTKLYKVVVENHPDFDPADVPDMLTNFDSLGRGATNNSDVLVEIVTPDSTTGIACNSGDYFMLPDDCTAINIYLPVEWKMMYSGSWRIEYVIYDVSIFKTVEDKPNLVNGHLRLCYYNYGTKNIFACESSITGRDVVRSLLEVCGCFFRLDRLHGLPEFVYPTKGGLYPSNTLYPADDLYPRTGTDQLYSMGKYISVIAENYEVKDYGRIQILKDIKSSDTVSVCEWQYEGDPDAENTYIIDDNIFYCADDMEYDYDNMPEVADMLEGMWGVISNLGYVPNITQALGAPWLECGDRIGLLTYDGGFESFVFRRTLKGIQNLRDTYESVGDEKNEAINNFGY